MKKILLAILLLIVGLVLFMPKVNLFYALGDLMKKELVQIQQKSIKDRWVDLQLLDATVFYDKIESIKAKEIDIKPWLLYNKITLKEIKPSSSIKRFFNFKANSAVITHSILDYKKAHIEADGDFGEISGEADLIARKIHLLLKPTKRFEKNQVVRDYFKKTKEGYVYESSF